MKTMLIFGLAICFLACKDTSEQENPSTDASHSHPTYKIAYNVLLDEASENYDVFSMELDGTNKKNITNFEGVEWVYHAQGDKVFFVSDKDTLKRNYQLFVMNADGLEKMKVSDLRLSDSWHGTRNNESEVIVTPHRSVDTAFYIIDRKGVIVSKLKPKLKYFSDPTFSPDGNKVIFRGAHFASKREPGFVDEIYIMDSDGSNLMQLSNYPKSDTTAMWYAYKAGPPKWHPTENFISYASFQNGKYSLFGVTLDGKKQWKLTNTMQSEVFHDWSSDGKWLVTDLSINDVAPYHIGLINWETKALRILTDTSYSYHQSPVFVEVRD